MSKASKGIAVTVNVILFLSFAAGISACIYFISLGQLSDRESAMLGVLLTLLSLLASWIITHMYAASQYDTAIKEVREEHRNNLRTYALKAAEKVNNLSNELNKLSIYLEEELDYTDYRTPDEELLAKEERIESAIHLVRTLKSVNDTALSDWEGVIGDELDQRREEKEEKEEELRTLIERMESLVEDQRQEFAGTHRDADSVRTELERAKRELRLAMSQLTDTSIPRRMRKKEPKQEIRGYCPSCRAAIEYRQRPLPRSFKSLPCPECGEKLISTFSSEHGFALKKREVTSIDVTCPECSRIASLLVGTFPGSSVATSCASCKKAFRVIRTPNGHEVKDVRPGKAATVLKNGELTEGIIAMVHKALPEQPWPVGIHKVIASTLKLPAPTVSQAISQLIKRRVFNPQIDGVVYVPLQSAPK